MVKCIFTPPTGCFVLLVLGAYGVAGIVFNIRELSNENFHQGKWPLNHKAALIALTFAQSGIILASISGIIATIRKAIMYFYGSALILLGVFAGMIIIGGVCLRDASKDLSQLIFHSLQNGNPEDFAWISYIQWKYSCCGVHSFMDWNLFNTTDLVRDSVPISCCLRTVRIPARDCGEGILIPNRKIEDIGEIINKEGCAEKLTSYHKSSLNYAGIEMIAVGIVSLVVATFLYIAVTRTLYLESNEDIENLNSEGATGSNATSAACANGETSGDSGAPSNTIDANGNKTFSSVGHYLNPSFRPSQLFKTKTDKNGNNSSGGSGGRAENRTQNVPITNSRKRSGRFRFQKSKNARISHTPVPRPDPQVPVVAVSPTEIETSIFKNLEMLFNPTDKYSTISTTPHPSISQNDQFIDFSNKIETIDPVVDKHMLAHHSSLPQVHVFPFWELNNLTKQSQKLFLPEVLTSSIPVHTSLKFPPITTNNGRINPFSPPIITIPPIVMSPVVVDLDNEVILEIDNEGKSTIMRHIDNTTIGSLASHTTFFDKMSQVGAALDTIQEESRNRLKSPDSTSSDGSTMCSSRSQAHLLMATSTIATIPNTSSLENENDKDRMELVMGIGGKLYLELENQDNLNIRGPEVAEILNNANNVFGLEFQTTQTNDEIQTAEIVTIFENELTPEKQCGLLDDAKIEMDIPLRDSSYFCVSDM